ncbi:MAG: FAD-dependent oxidoreductase [Neisseriaceae bacterium]|nr:FAD-dependent oxidoreductase [Neisseriaceae bacterium]
MINTALNAAAPNHPNNGHACDVAIIGGGLVGRLLAWQLAQANLTLHLYEAGSPTGEGAAAYVAAAMLTPLAEATAAEPQIIEMGLASVECWQHIIQQLTQPVFFQQAGSLLVWHPQDGAEASLFYRRLQRYLSPEALAAQVVGQSEAQLAALEPALATRFKEALLLKGEGQLDNRQVLSALLADLAQRPNVQLSWHTSVTPDALPQPATLIVDCRGFGAKKRWNTVQSPTKSSTLRGIRGEVVRVSAPEVSLNRPVRLLHPRYPIYCAPKQNGLFVIGATELESEDRSNVSVRSALELLSALHTLHPAFAEARILDMSSHCRPTLSHHLPEIRHHADSPIIDVNGLYRHGFLIAPVVVDAAAQLILARLHQRITPDWAHSQPRPDLFTWMKQP